MTASATKESVLPLVAELNTLKSIIQNLADGVIVADRNGKFICFNKVAETVLGLGALDVSSDQWSQAYGCFQPDGVTPFPSHELPLARALTGEMVGETEILIRNPERPEGVSILVHAGPVRNETGELYGAFAAFRDITKKKRSDSRIRTLMNAVEQTADSIVITNKNGLIEFVNPAFEQTTGYSRNEVLGQSPRILKSGVHDTSFYQHLWATINSGKVFRATITNRKKSGEVYFAEQTITPMRDAEGNISHFVSVIKDMTEARKIQEQESQMKLARAVQQHFYRVAPPTVAGFDIAGASFPAYATGGDYFDFVPLQAEPIGISVGDVSGHGISAALMMVELRACLRAFAWKSADLGEVFTSLNTALFSDFEQQNFATLVCCCLHPASRSLVYANAGHVPGYILGSNGAVKRQLDATDVPLGLFPNRVFTNSAEILMEPGDMLALLTDGITEAESPDQTQFGSERALEFLRAHQNESAEQIVSGLYRAVREFSDGLPQSDDITAVICKFVPDAPANP